MKKRERWFSNPTQVFWTCKALVEGREVSTKMEIREVFGWRLAAITERLRKHYGWPILTEYRGPESIAYYRLKPGTNLETLRYRTARSQLLGMRAKDKSARLGGGPHGQGRANDCRPIERP